MPSLPNHKVDALASFSTASNVGVNVEAHESRQRHRYVILDGIYISSILEVKQRSIAF